MPCLGASDRTEASSPLPRTSLANGSGTILGSGNDMFLHCGTCMHKKKFIKNTVRARKQTAELAKSFPWNNLRAASTYAAEVP